MSIKTLLVDDESSLLEQAKIFLERIDEELEVSTVSSAEKALGLLDEERYDVIVSDYQMPDMDGLEFLEVVREERESDIPFIIFTGKGREEVAMKALNLGADRYIKKEGNPKDQFEFLAHAIVRENNQYDLYEEKEKREKKIKKLYEASIELSTYDSDEEIYHQVLDSFESILDFEASSICMAGDGCLVVQATDAKNVEEGEERANDVGIRGLTYQNQKSYLIDDLSDWDEGQPSDPDFKSVLSIPIEDEGVFQALSYEKEYFDEFDLEMSELLISHMWEVVKDIKYRNELKKNKSWLSQIIENSSIPTFVIDEKHKVTHWNEACENLTDVSKETVIDTRQAWKGFYDEERPVMADLVVEEASAEKVKEHYGDKFSESDLLEEAYEAVDFFPEFGDEGRWVYFTAAPIKDSKGNKIGAIETLQDITERKEKEKALQETKQNYKELFEKSADALFVHDPDTGEILDVNQRMREMYGYSREEALGLTIEDTSSGEHPYTREEAKKRIQKAKEEGPITFEWRAQKKDGTLFWDETTLKEVEIGGESRILASVRDISERKEKEKELKRKEKYIDHTPEYITVLDEEGNIKYQSYPSDDIVELDPSEFMGAEAFEFVHPDDREKIQAIFSEVLENPGEEYRVELRGRGKEDWIWFETRAVNHLDDPEIEGIIITSQDITDRKEAEKRIEENKDKIERLHEISAEIQACDLEEEVYSLAVEAAEDILDFDICSFDAIEGDMFVTKKISTGTPEDGHTERRIEEGGLDSKTYMNQESYLVDDLFADKDAKPVKSDYKSAISVPIGEQGVFQAVSTKVDHFNEEDLKTAELLISHVSQALERIQMENREDFLHSLLRHDLGNKIQVIQGYAQLLEEDIDEGSREMIKKTEKATKDAQSLIEKVRTLKDVTAEHEIGTVEVCSVLKSVISDFEERLKEQDIELECEKEEIKAHGGPLLKQVFSNILENSIKHAECDKIRICSKERDHHVIISIEDDGLGIPDDSKEKIFERGYKKGEKAGSGLGMYLVKEIVESYGGSIEVKDSELGGARFDVRLQKVQE